MCVSRRPRDLAAVYLTIYNTTGTDDTLNSVTSGSGEETSIHSEVNSSMVENTSGLVIPAHSSVVLKPTTGHIMIQKLYGSLVAGQTVNLELDFEHAGPVTGHRSGDRDLRPGSGRGGQVKRLGSIVALAVLVGVRGLLEWRDMRPRSPRG